MKREYMIVWLIDPFEVACTVVSHRIDDDWPRLYRKLPFAPFRGQQTIDEDIAELYMIKTPVHEIARRSLNRWRRWVCVCENVTS